MSEWSVYLLRCADGTLYTGIATDVSRRISEHEQGTRGAKYLRGRGPLELVYERAVGDRSVATRVELRVKRLARIEKEDLQRLPSRIDEFLLEFRDTA
jgi:putative endonuclease